MDQSKCLAAFEKCPSRSFSFQPELAGTPGTPEPNPCSVTVEWGCCHDEPQQINRMKGLGVQRSSGKRA